MQVINQLKPPPIPNFHLICNLSTFINILAESWHLTQENSESQSKKTNQQQTQACTTQLMHKMAQKYPPAVP